MAFVLVKLYKDRKIAWDSGKHYFQSSTASVIKLEQYVFNKLW